MGIQFSDFDFRYSAVAKKGFVGNLPPVDSATGLPVLPDGLHWRIEQSRGEYSIRIIRTTESTVNPPWYRFWEAPHTVKSVRVVARAYLPEGRLIIASESERAEIVLECAYAAFSEARSAEARERLAKELPGDYPPKILPS